MRWSCSGLRIPGGLEDGIYKLLAVFCGQTKDLVAVEGLEIGTEGVVDGIEGLGGSLGGRGEGCEG